MRFPRSTKLSVTLAARNDGYPVGHDWRVDSKDGRLLASGHNVGTKQEARADAWNALEQIGLVQDE